MTVTVSRQPGCGCATAIAELAAEVRVLRLDLQSRFASVDERDANLVTAIDQSFGARPFNVRDLLDYAKRDDHVLCARLDIDYQLSGKLIGKALSRLEGRTVRGFTVRRSDAGADGVMWVVERRQ